MYEIEFYLDKNGKSEVLEYLDELKNYDDKEHRIKSAKIRAYINKLAKCGLALKEPYVKKIDKELWELRPVKDRILFACLHNNKFIILTIFVKKTGKTPKKEIKRAKKNLNEYRRKKKNE